MYGKRLREIRVNHGYSQSDFGELLGVSPSTVSSYETESHEPPIDYLNDVAEKFNVTVDYILGNNDGKTDYRTLISDSYDDFADYVSIGYTPEEAERMLAAEIEKYGKMILRLHYEDRRKVELFVRELREQGDY